MADLKDLERRVLARIAADRGPAATLASLGRAPRFALLCLLVALEAAFIWTFLRRRDFFAYPPARMAIVLGSYALVLLGAGWLALRPLYLAERRWLQAAAVAAGLALPVIFALLPAVDNGRPPMDARAHVQLAYFCFSLGAVLSGCALALAAALDRGGPGLGLAGIAAGAAGAMLMHVHCAINFPLHLLLGHATIPLASLAAARALVRWRA